MADFTFKAIGTQWCVSIDDGELSADEKAQIIDYVELFEGRFSRFRDTSEVNAFRKARAGVYPVSLDLAAFLARASRIREQTNGRYDPAVAELLEHAGYDASYTMQPTESVGDVTLQEWSITNGDLTIAGPVAFDLGGIGKGYCIDAVAALVASFGYKYFMVEAGGDMFGTTKANGAPWRVAIEYPGQKDMAAGTVELSNEAIAVSDSFRRRWGNWHHIVDPVGRKAVDGVVGAAAVAPSAWSADCMTSVLFLGEPSSYDTAAQEHDAAFLVFKPDDTCTISKNWKGEVF